MQDGVDLEPDYFRSVVAASPDCIRILDLNGRVEFVNPGGHRMFGIQDFDGRIRGAYWPDLWPTEHRDAAERAWRAAADGEPRSFRACWRGRDAQNRWLDTIVSPVFGGRDQAVQRILATSRDVTQEVESRLVLDTILDCIPAALFAKELETGRFVFLNEMAAELFGHPACEMVGKTAGEFVPPADAEAIRAADLEAAASDRTLLIKEQQVTQQDGQTHHRRIRKRVTPVGPGVRYVVCLTEDIGEERAQAETLRRALEEAQTASRAKSQFLAVMSHEIRSPLNGVLGMAQAMETGELPREQRARLQVIREAGQILLELLNDMLDLSRISAGKLQLEDGIVDGGEIGRAAQNLFHSLAANKDLSFELRLERDSVGPWRGDSTRVRQIVTNLISNAVKFTDGGRIVLNLASRGDGLLLEVSDTGPGIPAEMLGRIFEPFDQLDPSNTRRHGGSGLGLAICRDLAKMMGGEITVRSVVGEGSTFCLRLPLARAEVSGIAGETAAPPCYPAPAPSDRPLKILAAEDNAMNQLVLSTLLDAVGIHPHMVGNGEEAIAAWRREPWDLILMDVQMPVMDGLDATRAIRTAERSEGLARTPIVALTANAMTHQLDEYAACGIDSVVAKPVDIRALIEAIRTLAP
jgi:PAS domain S-box-containing protein